MKNGLKKEDREFTIKSNIQLKMIYPAIVTVLWEQFGWRRAKITRRLEEAENIWYECSRYGLKKSVLEMLEEETGIEMKLDGERSYHEFDFLDGKKKQKRYTPAQLMLVRRQQVRWIPTMIQSVVCLALYRTDGWNVVRLGRLINAVNEYRVKLGEDPAAYKADLESKTEFTLAELTDKYINATY